MPLGPSTFRIAVHCVFLLCLGGCATPPYQPLPKGWKPPAGVEIPIRGRVSLEFDSDVPGPMLREHRDMQMEAWGVFSRIFTALRFGANMPDPAVTIVLKGHTVLDAWPSYDATATVTAKVFLGEDTSTAPLATVTADGVSSGHFFSFSKESESSRRAQAYERALGHVAYKLLADPQLLALIQAEAPE
jgi:hypothetical protein